MATIIAISGFKRSGKDTFAEEVRDALYGYSAIGSVYIEPMAAAIKNVVGQIYNVSENSYLDAGLTKESPLPELTKYYLPKVKSAVPFGSYRYALDLVGETMKTLFGPDVWVDAIKRFVNDTTFFSTGDGLIIPDIRFAQEQKMLVDLEKEGHRVIRVLVLRKDAIPEWAKHGLVPSNPEELKIIKKDFRASNPEIDWCISNPKFDFIVKNDGPIEEVAEIAKEFVKKFFKDA